MHPPVRLVAIDMDGTLLPTFSQTISARNAEALRAAQRAGVTVAIATGRRTAYTAPLLENLGLRADMPLITSNGAVTRTLGGDPLDRSHLQASVARKLCSLLRPFGTLVFTFDMIGRGELVLEDFEQAHSASPCGSKPIATPSKSSSPLKTPSPTATTPSRAWSPAE